MRLRRLRRNGWAVWLGIAALVLNALVPVHLACDLAEALGAGGAGPGWRLLATLTGHIAPAHDHATDNDGDHGRHHPPDCPVCSALGALAGPRPAAPPLLSPPSPIAAAPAILPREQPRDGTAVASYRSRAPPLA